MIRICGRIDYAEKPAAVGKTTQVIVLNPAPCAAAPLNARDQLVYDHLVRMAAADLPCPTNQALTDALGMSSINSVSAAFFSLKRAGLIAVQTFQRARMVTITATGATTARPATTAPHWRDRGAQ